MNVLKGMKLHVDIVVTYKQNLNSQTTTVSHKHKKVSSIWPVPQCPCCCND